ncbi:hypothetical protein GGI43DRAFT_393264 [Trichoderma evansii]
MQRYLAQTPQEDAGTYARLGREVERSFEDQRCASIIIHCILVQEKNLQLDRPLIEANSSLICPQFSTGCSFTGPSKLSWEYHTYFGHFKLEFHIQTAHGNSVPPTNNPHHVKSSETLYTNKKWQNPKSIPCSDSRCSMEFFGADALEQWLNHINTHLEQFATPYEAIFKAVSDNSEPVQLQNSSDSRITYETEPNGQSVLCESLCELLKRSALEDNPKNINLSANRPYLSLTSPTTNSSDPQIAQGSLIENFSRSCSRLNQNFLERQLLPHQFVREAAHPVDISPRLEQQEESPTISDYSSNSSSPFLNEIFSVKNSSKTNTNSASVFTGDDDERAVLYNMAEQVSRSDLVNEFARFTMSWFIAWTANRRNNTDHNSHSPDVQIYENGSSNRCICGNKRKRSRKNGHRGRNKKQQKRDYGDDSDDGNEDEPGDGRGNAPHIAINPSNKGLKPFLACPFFQRDKMHASFGHGRWKLCAHGSWNGYHRVREHVYRKHILPENHCERCFKDLKGAPALQHHCDLLQSVQKPPLYMTSDRKSQLRAPMKRGIPDSEKWKIMYRILFPEDARVPSPYKDKLSYGTEELRDLAAEIELICNSSSSDVRAQIQQIRDAAERAMRSMNGISSREQHNFQEINWTNSASGTNIMMAVNDDVPFPLSSDQEYMAISEEFMNDLPFRVPTSILGGQDNSMSHTLDSSHDVDTSYTGNLFNGGDAPFGETFFERDMFDVGDAPLLGDMSYGADVPDCGDSRHSFPIWHN